MAESYNDSGRLYPIRTVSAMTGVNAVTLRAWERRYGLVTPERTATGHRLYSERDIATIKQALTMVEQGMPISQVPRVLRQQRDQGADADVRRPDTWQAHRERMIQAVTRLDEAALEAVHREALASHSAGVTMQRLIVPLVREVGCRWESAQGSIAEEHFFEVYLRNKLGARFHHLSNRNRGPKLLLAGIPGDRHEVGLLLFTLAAHEHDYRHLLLGADLPLPEVAPAARLARCDAVVLSGRIDPPPKVLDGELRDLVETVRIPVFVGGTTSVRHAEAIRGAGAWPLGDDIEASLERMGTVLLPQPAGL